MTPVQRLNHLVKVLENVRKKNKTFDLLNWWGKVDLPKVYQDMVGAWEKEYVEKSGLSFCTSTQRREVMTKLENLLHGKCITEKPATKKMELSCGCAIGYAGYDPKFREQGFKLRMEVAFTEELFREGDCDRTEVKYFISVTPSYKQWRDETAIMKFFRIDYDDSHFLFTPTKNRTVFQEISAVKKVINRLKKEDKEKKRVRGY